MPIRSGFSERSHRIPLLSVLPVRVLAPLVTAVALAACSVFPAAAYQITGLELAIDSTATGDQAQVTHSGRLALGRDQYVHVNFLYEDAGNGKSAAAVCTLLTPRAPSTTASSMN